MNLQVIKETLHLLAELEGKQSDSTRDQYLMPNVLPSTYPNVPSPNHRRMSTH